MEKIPVPTANDPQTQSAPASNAVSESNDPLGNPAIQHCMAEWTRVYRAGRAKGDHDYHARAAAFVAYRASMPPLTCAANIRNFVACVAHGILIEAIDSKQATKLLYAAQVALSAQPRESARSNLSAMPPVRTA